MKVVAVAKLKASLSRYLSAVKVGEEVLITERSRPIAKIIPIPPAQGEEEQRLRRLEAQGIVRMPTRKLPKNFWDKPRLADPEGLILRALLGRAPPGSMSFWDSSALIPLWADEPRSESIAAIARRYPVRTVWWGTLVECQSALERGYGRGVSRWSKSAGARVSLRTWQSVGRKLSRR